MDSQTGPSSRTRSATVMIVEDDESLRLLLRKTMQKRGFEIFEAKDGLEAQQVFEDHRDRIEIIVSDVRMPVVDGVGLLSYIRERSRIPFVFMTGFSSHFQKKTAEELGADSYIQKPFAPDALAETLRRLLH